MDNRIQQKFRYITRTLSQLLRYRSRASLVILSVSQFADSPHSMAPFNVELKNIAGYSTPWSFIKEMTESFDRTELKIKAMRKDEFHSLTVREFELLRNWYLRKCDEIMKEEGYCCGIWYCHYMRRIQCSGRKSCVIKIDGTKYYRYKDCSICEICFSEKESKFTLEDGLEVDKSNFKQYTWISKRNESFVKCIHCRKDRHVICIGVDVNPGTFVCCETEIHPAFLKSQSLNPSECDTFIENRIGAELCERFKIRTLSEDHKIVTVKDEVRKFKKLGHEVRTINKTMFVFYDDPEFGELCIFAAMYTLVGYDANEPMKNSLYINYIDSVKHLPSHARTTIYKMVLAGLFAFYKENGYRKLFIWSAPPKENQDYIFYMKPKNQKTPTQEILNNWYQSLLDNMVTEGILESWVDFTKYYEQKNITNVDEFPYFENDLWNFKISECIKQVEKERKDLERALKSAKSKLSKDKKKEKYEATVDDLQYRLEKFDMDKEIMINLKMEVDANGGDYFCANFSGKRKASSMDENDHETQVNTPLDSIFNSRDSLTDEFWSRNLEFSTPRKALYSTQAILKIAEEEKKKHENPMKLKTQVNSESPTNIRDFIRDFDEFDETESFSSGFGSNINFEIQVKTPQKNIVTVKVEKAVKVPRKCFSAKKEESDSDSQLEVRPLDDYFKYQKFTPKEVIDFVNKHTPRKPRTMGLEALNDERSEDKKCPFCGCDHTYRNNRKLKNHLIVDHMKQQYQCRICEKWFPCTEQWRNNHQAKCKA